MKIEICSIQDYLEIFYDLELYWGDRRTEHIHHPIFVREFGNTAFVIKVDDLIVGYLFGFFSQTEKCGYIHIVGIHEEYKRQGIGKKLYEHFTKLAKQNGCDHLKAITTPTNKRSINFHLSMDFELIGENRINGIPINLNYSGQGNHRVVMIKKI
jgi:GNAT superfamily N-acetyltransferase